VTTAGGGYRIDRAYGERFVPLVARLLGHHALESSPFHMDARRATDLIVLRAEPLEIGVRIRRPGYEHFWPEFTIRSHRDNGAATELAKVMQGFMTWMFYGHGNHPRAAEPVLSSWMLVDMRVFRWTLQKRGEPRAREAGALVDQSNGDGTHFVACDARLFPRRLILDASRDVAGGGVVAAAGSGDSVALH
jgi:hypothetical protein